jgi:hypothetical protein
MANYSKGVNLASDVITPTLRVSTASFPSDDHWGGHEDALIETWIFDARPMHSKQFYHRRGREKAIRFHNRLVRKLRRLLQMTTELREK